ncbi:hypothetical protein D3C84_649730 [compost metagenome]
MLMMEVFLILVLEKLENKESKILVLLLKKEWKLSTTKHLRQQSILLRDSMQQENHFLYGGMVPVCTCVRT